MKPITDEIIHSLIERAERRQGSFSAANDITPVPNTNASVRGARIISLERAHPALRLRQTVNGIFCYAQRS